MAENLHISVLKDEVLEAFENLDSKNSSVLIDCTMGFGGHSLALAQKFQNLKIIGVDRDENALKLAKERISMALNSENLPTPQNPKTTLDSENSQNCQNLKKINFLQSDFGSCIAKIQNLNSEILKNVRGILADVGVSSMQLDDKSRGFSFESENLDMRMDTKALLSAKIVLNTYDFTSLERIFRDFGEIRESKKLARLVTEFRAKKPFESAKEFANLIAKNFPKKSSINPATLAFQAVRIEVNGELAQLQSLLDSVKNAHAQGFLAGARVAIISFHSLEDRIVKENFKAWAQNCICPESALKCECGGKNALGKIITKKPITPKDSEILHNPRARSAKLRIFELN